MGDNGALPQQVQQDLDKLVASNIPTKPIGHLDITKVPLGMLMDGMRLIRNLKIPFERADVYKTASDMCIDPEDAISGANVLIAAWALQHDAENFKKNHYDTVTLFEKSANPLEQVQAFRNWLGGPAHDKPQECGPKVSELALPPLLKDMVSDAPASPLYTNPPVKNPRGLV